MGYGNETKCRRREILPGSEKFSHLEYDSAERAFVDRTKPPAGYAAHYEEFVPAITRQKIIREDPCNASDDIYVPPPPSQHRKLAGCQPSRGFDVFMMLVVSIGFMVARRIRN